VIQIGVPNHTPLAGLTQTAAPSRAEQLADSVQDRIHADALVAGRPLGPREDLQRSSGFSRPTINEAVRLLRDRGVVTIKPGRGGGLFVADHGPVVRLRQTLLSVTEEPTTVVEAIELRDHLELLIDLGAARCRSQRDITALRALAARLGDATDWQAFMEANWSLHERIARICPNTMARAVYVGTLGHIGGSAASYADGADSTAYRLERHQIHIELVEAIASGDEARVRAAVHRHHASG
jgi:GntR family transcriptional repressor for pyruvate dehydrogenase complex